MWTTRPSVLHTFLRLSLPLSLRPSLSFSLFLTLYLLFSCSSPSFSLPCSVPYLSLRSSVIFSRSSLPLSLFRSPSICLSISLSVYIIIPVRIHLSLNLRRRNGEREDGRLNWITNPFSLRANKEHTSEEDEGLKERDNQKQGMRQTDR